VVTAVFRFQGPSTRLLIGNGPQDLVAGASREDAETHACTVFYAGPEFYAPSPIWPFGRVVSKFERIVLGLQRSALPPSLRSVRGPADTCRNRGTFASGLADDKTVDNIVDTRVPLLERLLHLLVDHFQNRLLLEPQGYWKQWILMEKLTRVELVVDAGGTPFDQYDHKKLVL